MVPANKRVIALDTNILLAIEKFKINLFGELRGVFGRNALIVLPSEVEKELEKLGKKNAGARIAKSILKNEGIKIVKTDAKDADSALIELAEKNAVIATNDKKLRKKIKALGGRIAYLRKKSLLETS